MQRGLGKPTWAMTLGELRGWLGLEPDAYESVAALKAYILTRAQDELDTRSDWSFSFLVVKTGRRITGVEFTIRPARSPKNNPATEKWKKMKPEQQKLVLASARTRPRWEEGKTDAEITGDPAFWQYLPDLLAEAEQGQKSLGL